MLTWNAPYSYYLYRNQEMGFEYELAKAFANFVGANLEVEIAPDWNDLVPWLQEEKGDFIAAGMTVTPKRKRVIDFSKAYLKVQQQVMVRRRDNAIKKAEDLVGKTVVVREGTSYQERLEDIRSNVGNFEIETKNKPTPTLIEMLSRGKIDITVADSHIARLNRRYYPNIKPAFVLGEPEYLGWGIKKGRRSLKRKINKFFDLIKKNGEHERLYEKYYGYTDLFDYVDLKRFERAIRTELPKYESIIRSEATRYGFDWRLITAVIYQESRFNTKARSWTGVRGLMQLTEATAEELGVSDRLDPIQSIRGGVRYLKKLYDSFDDIEDKDDRLLISLAAYNVGRSHVLDAQQIAKEKG